MTNKKKNKNRKVNNKKAKKNKNREKNINNTLENGDLPKTEKNLNEVLTENDVPKENICQYEDKLKTALNDCKMVCIISPHAHYSNKHYVESIMPMIENIDWTNAYQATKFMKEFNTNVSTYWKDYDICGAYGMVGMYYNDRNKRNGKAIYPYSFKELTQLYNKIGVKAEVYLMKTSICCYQLTKNLNILIEEIDKRIPLGKLKADIEIPLTVPNLNKYTCFIMIVASNGIISIGHPFTLRYQPNTFSDQDNKLKLTKDLPLHIMGYALPLLSRYFKELYL